MLKRIHARLREGGLRLGFFAVSPIMFRFHIYVALLLNRVWLRIPPNAEPKLNQVKRILVIRLDAIGDAVLNTAFLRELRDQAPAAEITLIVSEQLYPVFRLCPYVDDVFPFECSVPFRWKPFLLPWRALRIARRRLWQKRFDLALLPRREFDIWSGHFLAFFSRAPWRVGYTEHVNDRKGRLNPGADLLFTQIIKAGEDVQHEVACNLHMLEELGGRAKDDRVEMWTSSDDETIVDGLLRAYGNDANAPLIAVSPGSSSALTRWPIAKFAELITALAEAVECRFVVVGSPDEQELGAMLAAAMPERVVNLAGKTTLRQCAAVLKRCIVAVANDSGPMHIAAAMGTPVVALFGSSCEHRFGPWKDHTVVTLDLPCRPCNQGHVIDRCATCIFDEPRCLTELPVSKVASAITRVLSVAKLPSLTVQ